MSCKIAGIDVHKKLLVVVIVDAAKPDVRLQSRRFGTGAAELHHLSAWLCSYGLQEAVMESTAQYWKPVWMELEPHMKLHLAQAQSNKAPKGRKGDLVDTKRSNESAGQNHSGRSAKGNRFMRRLLCQAAQAAARTNGSQLQVVFKRLVVRLGYVKAVWAIAHRLCKIVWNILHKNARFVEFSETRNPKAVHRAITHHLKALRRLGYQIPPSPTAAVGG